MPKYQHVLAKLLALKPAIYGAYTELFAGLSTDITAEQNGGFVVPWGAVSKPRKDIAEACKASGRGLASSLWDWCEEKTRPYA